MASDITWSNASVKLADLQPWEHNPRQLTTAQGERLAMSLDEFGQVETIAIGPDGEVYNGHQRLAILLQQHGPAHTVDARQASRPLTHDERRKLTIYLHEGATGDWDFDALGNLYEVEELIDWGFPEWKLEDVAGANGHEEPEEPYSRKIEAPIYRPTGEKPDISELFDNSRTIELIASIDGAEGLTDAQREFLRIAAQRHTVLKFNRIAEYYAHADESLQVLMEESALVIIDFDRAIELGYVKLSEEIAKLYSEDYPDA